MCQLSFSPAHLKNSVEFKSRLLQFAANNNFSDCKLASFDVAALFTNVPIDIILCFISRKIDQELINVLIPKESFISLIKLCVNNNEFQFNNSFYRQKFGVAMGSPLSPVLVNLFMECF